MSKRVANRKGKPRKDLAGDRYKSGKMGHDLASIMKRRRKMFDPGARAR